MLELSSGQLSFLDKENGQKLRHADVRGCTVGSLNKPRKGHPHALRLDMAKADSEGDSKHVVSFGDHATQTGWTEALAGMSAASK